MSEFVEVNTAELTGQALDWCVEEAAVQNEEKLSCEEECSLTGAITLSRNLCTRGGYGSNQSGFTTLKPSQISTLLKKHLRTWTFLMRETRSRSVRLLEAKLGGVVKIPAVLAEVSR